MLKNYVKLAWKVLLRRKFFTFVSLFGITFTLLVLMVAATLVDRIALPARPGSRFDRTMFVGRLRAQGKNTRVTSYPSYYFLNKYFRDMKQPEAISIHSRPSEISAYVGGRKLGFELVLADDVFWYILEFPVLEGRVFNENEVKNAEPVAVITDRLKKQVYGDAAAVGKYFETTTGTYRVVGVIPADEVPTKSVNGDIYVPITTSQWDMSNDQLFTHCEAFVLAHDESDFNAIRKEYAEHLTQARKDLSGTFDMISCPIGTQADQIVAEFFATNQDDYLEGDTNTGLWIAVGGLIGLGLLFMLFPAINLVNLNISRIIERSSEIGVRKAFGASSMTLLGQFIAENVFLTLIGGAMALVLTWITIMVFNDSGIIPYGHLELNLRIFWIALVLSLVFGLLSGALPAYRMSRLHPVEALRGGKV